MDCLYNRVRCLKLPCCQRNPICSYSLDRFVFTFFDGKAMVSCRFSLKSSQVPFYMCSCHSMVDSTIYPSINHNFIFLPLVLTPALQPSQIPRYWRRLRLRGGSQRFPLEMCRELRADHGLYILQTGSTLVRYEPELKSLLSMVKLVLTS